MEGRPVGRQRRAVLGHNAQTHSSLSPFSPRALRLPVTPIRPVLSPSHPHTYPREDMASSAASHTSYSTVTRVIACPL